MPMHANSFRLSPHGHAWLGNDLLFEQSKGGYWFSFKDLARQNTRMGLVASTPDEALKKCDSSDLIFGALVAIHDHLESIANIPNPLEGLNRAKRELLVKRRWRFQIRGLEAKHGPCPANLKKKMLQRVINSCNDYLKGETDRAPAYVFRKTCLTEAISGKKSKLQKSMDDWKKTRIKQSAGRRKLG